MHNDDVVAAAAAAAAFHYVFQNEQVFKNHICIGMEKKLKIEN
jgi:hypothetical protein